VGEWTAWATWACWFQEVGVGRGGDEWPFRVLQGSRAMAAARYRERESATAALTLDVDNFFEQEYHK
tara:strand:- start:25749 stop:25949 length:201 start_codon:yes stop_codon:yes gene_type:complete